MNYLKSELEFIERVISQGGANSQDKERIFELYKKYIEPNHKRWVDTNCASCSSSIMGQIWGKTRDFILKNRESFVG